MNEHDDRCDPNRVCSGCAPDWRKRLRDFAADSEQHTITYARWREDRTTGITLYADEDFFTAYFDDAGEMWSQADDTLPMFHIMVKNDPPHRTCIHAMHLAAWAQHCARVCMPLHITGKPEVNP